MTNEFQITKSEYEYLVYILLVKIIAFIELHSQFELDGVIEELNCLFMNKYFFNESNIISLGKQIIDIQFPKIIKQMLEKSIDTELSLTKSKFIQIEKNKEWDKMHKNYKNRGDMLSDYENGQYYRFFQNMQRYVDRYDSSRTDIGAGEAIYHSFARFYSEGVNEYFKYFKIMSDNNLINYQNQNQENGFCDCVPCYYWFLNSKEDLKYFNKLIQMKDIKLNHIAGNEHGPSILSMIIDMLLDNFYWDRRKNKCIQ